MNNHKIEKCHLHRSLYINLLVIFLFTACLPFTNIGQRTNIPVTATKTVTGVVATYSQTPKISSPTPAAIRPQVTMPTSTAVLILPTPEAPVQQISEGLSFDYHAIPLGKKLDAEVKGRKISIEVKKVITGQDADAIAIGKAPEEMQWTIIQLVVTYVEGEKGKRVQLLEENMFDIVSKGHVNIGLPFLTFTPSPHISDIKILPGENSLGYLAFQAYKDDPTPLLRFKMDQNESFFRLTNQPTPIAQPEKEFKLVSTTGTGTESQPVPIGTDAYVDYSGSIYKIQVQKVLHGFDAWKKISDGWGINKEPPQGKEYVMPYVSVQVVRASHITSEFDNSLFSSYSRQGNESQPWNFFCPLPCFQSATLYPSGSVSGWVPLLTTPQETSPMMVFDQRVYFQLAPEPNQVATFKRQLSPDAISFANRKNIKQLVALKQVGPVNVIGFSPDDRFVVTGGDDKSLHVWESTTGKEVNVLKGHKARIRDISFSLDGKQLATTSATNEILLWDTNSWQLLKAITIKGRGFGVKFLPDGTLLSVNEAGVVQIWDVSSK